MLIQKNKNIFSKILILLMFFGNIFADPPLWNEDDSDGECVLDNYPDYENNGSITSKIYLNGIEGGQLGDMVAAFVGTEQRGVGCANEIPPFLGGGFAFLMMVYSNQTNGEILTFQYYSSNEDVVYDCNETLEFISNMTEGNVEDPFQLTLNYSNLCEDELACNFNQEGSCLYAEQNQDCNGNCLVEIDCLGECGGDAIEDCLGDCNGIAFFDECGNCIIDPSDACIQDCNGVWGGAATLDDCGVCNGNNLDQDCAGVCFGEFWDSDCGCVPPYNTGDECDDCEGVPNGTAFLDNCNNCVGGNTGLEECPGYDYTLELSTGANLISFYALPEDTSLDYMLLSNNNDYIYAVLGLLNSSINIGDNVWAGSLSNINQNSGYWFKSLNVTDLIIENAWNINQNISYNLTQGANLVSFPSESDYDIEDLISIYNENNFDWIIGQSVIAFRLDGEWQGSLNQLSSGKGYYFVLNSPIEDFMYTFPDAISKNSKNEVSQILHNQSSLQSFYILETSNLDELETGDWIVAYKDNVIVGSRKYNLETYLDIPVMGDDGSSYTQGYCVSGDTPYFKVLKNTGEYIDLLSNTPKWNNLSVNMIDLELLYEVSPLNLSIENLYPNPFNPSINFDFEIGLDAYVDISILDINGRLVDNIYNGYIQKGIHSYQWNASEFTSGIYFFKILTPNSVLNEKITLIK